MGHYFSISISNHQGRFVFQTRKTSRTAPSECYIFNTFLISCLCGQTVTRWSIRTSFGRLQHFLPLIVPETESIFPLITALLKWLALDWAIVGSRGCEGCMIKRQNETRSRYFAARPRLDFLLRLLQVSAAGWKSGNKQEKHETSWWTWTHCCHRTSPDSSPLKWKYFLSGSGISLFLLVCRKTSRITFN